MNKGVSILICCYNSASRLPDTIRHIALQQIADTIPWELIVVNNASIDNTGEVAIEEWNKYGCNANFSIVNETKPGLIHARRKGIESSNFEYVIFCDDDNWLQSDYVQRAFDLMESNPQIGALGGQSRAVSDSDFPDWFADYESGYAVGIQSKQSEDISSLRFLWGAGMISKLSLLLKVFDDRYPFLLTGRSGNILLAGDDSEICGRILLLGYTLYYDSSLQLQHFISKNRLTWAYKKKMYEGFEFSTQAIYKYRFVYLLTKNGKFANIQKIIFVLLKNLFAKLLGRRTEGIIDLDLWTRIAYVLSNENILKDAGYNTILGFYFSAKQNLKNT